MTKHKLVEILQSEAKVPHIYDVWSKDYRYRHVPNMPVVHWPDDKPCVDINLFLMDGIFKKNWAVKHSGGTVRTYASHLSHIVRFCFSNKLNFVELSDKYFELFINGLMAEKKSNGNPKRSNTSVVTIGRYTLNFLIFAGEKVKNKNFIGKKGCRLNYIEKEYVENNVKRTYVEHYSFPSKDPYRRRLPLAQADEKKLLEYVSNNSDENIAMRDSCLIKAFKATGGRRSEVANIKVVDIKRALSSNDIIPMLKLITLKQRKNGVEEKTREVPVYRSTLKRINRYINRFRARTIKEIEESSGEAFIDHGYVFIGETTGMPLKPDSITTYFNRWGKLIGAEGQLVAHAFRHTYITEKIEMLIQLFELKDESELKAKFASEENFSKKLKEWTGHKNEKSLQNYIHLAFEGLSGVRATFDKAEIVSGVNSAKAELDDLKNRVINKNVSSAELLDEVEHLLSDLIELLQ
jgi:site-specific recombinase XerC